MPTCEVCGGELPEMTPWEYAVFNCWSNSLEEMRRLPLTGITGGVYVEGWAVRERAGQLESFEHGWVEIDGRPHDITPHNHVVAEEGYFGAFRSTDPERDLRERDIHIPPLCRAVASPGMEGQPNPRYDAARANAYAEAKRKADEYCAGHRSAGSDGLENG